MHEDKDKPKAQLNNNNHEYQQSQYYFSIIGDIIILISVQSFTVMWAFNPQGDKLWLYWERVNVSEAEVIIENQSSLRCGKRRTIWNFT